MLTVFQGMFNCMTVQPTMAAERTVFYRERASAYYAPGPYSLATGIVELPYLAVQAVIMVCITYWWAAGSGRGIACGGTQTAAVAGRGGMHQPAARSTLPGPLPSAVCAGWWACRPWPGSSSTSCSCTSCASPCSPTLGRAWCSAPPTRQAWGRGQGALRWRRRATDRRLPPPMPRLQLLAQLLAGFLNQIFSVFAGFSIPYPIMPAAWQW